MPDKNITFEIQEHFGVIGSRDGGWNKELNLIRWNGGPAKYDIREWDEHHERMSRGITLSPWEMRTMVDLFISRNNSAAVSRGRAIESQRNARRLAARREAEAARAAAEREAMEGTVPPAEEKSFVTQESPLVDQKEETSGLTDSDGGMSMAAVVESQTAAPEREDSAAEEQTPENQTPEDQTAEVSDAVTEGDGAQEAEF